MLHSLRFICYKLYCKLIESLSRSRAKFDAADPTQFYIEHFSPLQKQAAEQCPEVLNSTPNPTNVAVLLPFRDRWDLTHRAAHSALAQGSDEFVVRLYLLDNGSAEQQTLDGIAALIQQYGEQVVHVKCAFAFNFSRIINTGAARAGNDDMEWLFLLNNDVEITGKTDLSQLVAFGQTCPNVGAIGCTLTFPDGRLQHLFTAPGVKIVAAHPLKGRLPGDWEWFRSPRPVAAITGAGLLVKYSLFQLVGGFETQLPTVGQDVDFCLKLQQRDLVNWVLPHIRWVHHEGASRGFAIDRKQVETMYERWGNYLTHNPYYAVELSRWSEQPALAKNEGPYPWQYVLL